MGMPTTSFAVSSVKELMKDAAIDLSTMNLRVAVHRCPEKLNAALTRLGITADRSVLDRMITQLLPPNSACNGFP
jgi:hypothetical protein